ncbi:hypothetical protein BXA50_16665, partial [Enterococcus faecium]
MRVTTSCSSCVHTQLLFKYDHTLARYRSQPSSPYIYARDELLDGHFPIVVPCFFSATEALCQRFFYRTYHFNANNIQKKSPFTNINYVSKRTTYRGTTFFRKFPSLKPNISKREIGVRFNGRTVPNLPTYRQIILQGHFQLFLLDSSHQPEPLCKVSKLTFLFNEIDILLLGLIYMRKTEKSSTKF